MRKNILNKDISRDQLKLLKLLDENEIEFFSLQDIERKFPDKFKDLNKTVKKLADKKLLIRLEKSKYARINFSNEFVTGTFIAPDSAVAYWSAMHKHGLTSRFPSKVFVQTSKRKREKSIRGVSYQFVTISKNKRFGITSMGYGNNKFPITDVEKTIIDCFDLPQYSGGMDNLMQAFALAKLSSPKMIDYAEKFNNISLIKRLGYISELLDKKGMKRFVNYALSKTDNTYVLFEPGGNNAGEFVNKWKIRLNISKESILDMSREIY